MQDNSITEKNYSVKSTRAHVSNRHALMCWIDTRSCVKSTRTCFISCQSGLVSMTRAHLSIWFTRMCLIDQCACVKSTRANVSNQHGCMCWFDTHAFYLVSMRACAYRLASYITWSWSLNRLDLRFFNYSVKLMKKTCRSNIWLEVYSNNVKYICRYMYII